MKWRTPAQWMLTTLVACVLLCEGQGWSYRLAVQDGNWGYGLATVRERNWGSGIIVSTPLSAFPHFPFRPFSAFALWQQAEQAPSAVTPSGSTQQAKPLSLEQRADIFMARKAYPDAVDYYTRALRQSGQSDPALWNKLGIAYQQQMSFNTARSAYKEAIRRRHDYPEAWNNLGTIYYLLNKFGKSIKYYRKAISFKPGAASFHLNLGTSFYRIKKPKEAVDEYRQALMLDPNILNERSTTGTVVQARGADVEYYFYMAKVFASLGRVEDAVRYLRRAFEDGFKEFKKLDEDPDFLKINQDPSYIALRNNPPVPIKD
jgi:tetratricopeptide (TPR) repeat protein